jgi:hypothetical protein
MRGSIDRETLLLEKEDVRRKTLDLVVYPKNASWTWHAVKIGVIGKA